MCSFDRNGGFGVGHQDGASAPTGVAEEGDHDVEGCRTAQAFAHQNAGEGDHRVRQQDSASAPTPHPRSPCPYRSTGVSIFRILYCDWYRNIEMYLTPYHMKEPNSYEVRPRKTPPAFSTSPGL